jgi:hypothetical protein
MQARDVVGCRQSDTKISCDLSETQELPDADSCRHVSVNVVGCRQLQSRVCQRGRVQAVGQSGRSMLTQSGLVDPVINDS